MKDSISRQIRYLRLSVTDLCNYRCQYCMPAEGVEKRPHNQILSVEECIEMAAAAVSCGIRKIRLTGGEPLVRKGIVEICKGISALPGLEELCLTTNGSLLPTLSVPLRQAGVNRLNVSIDTLQPRRFAQITRTGTLSQAIEGLRAAEAAGFSHLKLNVVLIGGLNDDEVESFVELTRHHPYEVRFIELMPMGPCAGWSQERFISADQVIERCPALMPIGSEGVARRFQVPGWAGTVGLIEPMSHRFCSSCDRIRITSDGTLKPCLHSRQEIPLRGLHGEALRQAIEQGILSKPERHHLNDAGTQTPRRMNEIGG